MGSARRRLDRETHDRLIDRPDFFHAQRPVADTLAFKDGELFEDAVDRAVADQR